MTTTSCFTIDIPKMKRWHGPAPLLEGQKEADFDAFIRSLATCVRSGDALTESLVYRYGVERWRMGQLLFQREQISYDIQSRLQRFNEFDEERRKFREDKKSNGAERADFVIEEGTRDAVIDLTWDEDVSSIRRNMHYREEFKFDEMSAGRSLEALISQCEMVERALAACDAITKDILHQMAIHRITLNERGEQESREMISAYIDELMDAQERERQQKAALLARPVANAHS